VSGNDPFGVLGLEARFGIDRGEVERAYLARIGASHPDIAGADAERDGASLNEARAALLDDESRARVLLARLDPAGERKHTDLPDGFLMETMAWREALEGADPDEIRETLDELRSRRGELIKEAGTILDSEGAGSPESVEELYRTLNAWRFIERLLEQAPG